MKKILLEGCVDSIDEANYFYIKQIDRLELCSNLLKGGLSPKLDLVKFVHDKKIDSVVMLRNKNNFKLNIFDINKFKKQIKKYKENGINKFIFGFIKNGRVDIKACKRVISLLDNNDVYAFHMAIDLVDDYNESIQILINLGFSWVLTKGGKGQAIDNLENIKELVKNYNNKIKILVGGNVRYDNYLDIQKATNARWFHGRKIK